MHLETLKVFCDLAELQSFSKTAEKHHLSQSAVSQQLAHLELMHKCEFVNRRKRPIELTREGQLLYQAAKDILERYSQLASELNTIKSSTDGRLNVGAIFSIGMHGLAKYVKKFMVKYPNVNVHIGYLSCTEIYDNILSGDIDIGLVAVPKRDKRVDVYDFKNEPLVLVCSPSHPLAGKSRINIHKIQFERFIAFEKDVPTRRWIDGILARYNITIYPVMEFDNIETIKRAVEINAGLSILPRTTVVQELHSGSISAVEFSNENFIRPTGVVVRKDKVLSQAGRYLIELLRKNA